jgi:xanthine dehydrogenase accessory factor
MPKNNLVLIRGGGDLASGVALRLHRAGIKVMVTELARPLAVRRMVSFAEAVYQGQHSVEGVKARLVGRDQLPVALDAGEIPVIIDPDLDILSSPQEPQNNNFAILVVVDGRLTKQPPDPLPIPVPLHIGLGPGFHAGYNCHAVIETRRSHTLGRVYWEGTSQPDSGEPEGDPRRVLRAPCDGIVLSHADIGDHLQAGQLIAEIQSKNENRMWQIFGPFKGILRGLIHSGLPVTKGMKIGDVDPRDDPAACFLVSDKALAIGGGVMEAILSKPEIRQALF